MTAIEWVPGQWDQVTAGDRAKIVHSDGEQVIIGTAAGNYSAEFPIFAFLNHAGNICFSAKNAVWSLFVEAPTKPKLPTEPGLYRLSNQMVVLRNGYGEWQSPNGFDTVNQAITLSSSFTRLEPVADTAKRILGKLDAVSVRGFVNRVGARRTIYDGDWNDVADEFGVTS